MQKKLADFMFASYLDEGEKLLHVFHRHPFIVIPKVIGTLLLGVGIPAILWYLFPQFWLLFFLWIFVTALRIFRLLMVWYHDVILVTDVSLIDVYWQGLFNKSSTRLEYQMIEGVSQEVRGIIRTMFKYGDISVQVMSGGNSIGLKDAMNPKKIEKIIMDYQQKMASDQNMKDANALKSLLLTMVRQHIKDEK